MRSTVLAIHTTYRASITNHAQVRGPLDRHGWSGSKLWNVGLYHVQTEWDDTGEIPEEDELKSAVKSHPTYTGLHSQSSQRILEEFAEAFTSWYTSDDDRANPPGFRKRNYYDDQGNRVHEEHPRSTITWKQQGFRHDAENTRVRLSNGAKHKSSKYAREYILVEYDTRPDATVEHLQQVRAVYDAASDAWELHLVCKHNVETPDAPGEETAGIDLGICTFAAVAYSTNHAELYPGDRFKADNYYFAKEIAKCDKSHSRKARRLHDTWGERRHSFVHEWRAHVAEQCVEHDVGEVVIGDPSGIRVDETINEAKHWGAHGNVDLHTWPFDKAATVVEYKLRRRGVEVTRESERDTSKTCACCGRKRTANRVERGLYACDECRVVAHGDVGGAENIRRGVGAVADAQREEPTESTSESGEAPEPRRGAMNAGRQDGVEDRSTGWLAQPAVYLYDVANGFAPRDHVVACKP